MNLTVTEKQKEVMWQHKNPSSAVQKLLETTKQQIKSDGWWTEHEQERVNVASGEDCLV